MSSLGRTRLLLRLELSEALRSRWLVFSAVVYASAFGLFVWLGLHESTVLGFTGMSRVILNLASALVLSLPLVALVATNQSVVRARTSGFFEMFLTQPCTRGEWLGATVLSRLVVLLLPVVVLLFGALFYGLSGPSDPELIGMVLRTLVVSLALGWSFVGVGFLISALSRSPERATVLALLVWLGASVMHDFALIGVLLRHRLPPEIVFALAASNPVEAARIAILGAVDPELSVLGPVGFWIANRLGPALSLGVGVGWPLLVGVLALVLTSRRLGRMDLVG